MNGQAQRQGDGPIGTDWSPPPGPFRRKGNIGPTALTLLAIVGGLPLLMALCRILAMPGAASLPVPGADVLRAIGFGLNQWASLSWVPPADRSAILYLLLLPTGALLVAVARLTFGLRVLGVRAILIAIGFQQAGFLPSLALMAIVIGIIVAIRPSMRRARLPLFARLTVILSLAAVIMVGAIVFAPWLRSEAVWGVAFFPVIIVAMVAEGIARTIASDNVVTAAWRLGWTLILAVIIALIGQSTVVGEVAVRFPELMVTQLIAIVFIAEFLDYRLLEPWPDRLHRLLGGAKPWYSEQPRVAVVRNRWNTGVIGRLNRPAPRKYRRRSVRRVLHALRELGYKARVFEGDIDMLRELRSYLPPEPGTGRPGGVVLNLATGTQGHGRFSQVPAMLEMAGVAYTGPDPIALARIADRYTLMSLLREAGVPVPLVTVMNESAESMEPPFPVAARPRCEPDGSRTIATDAADLRHAVKRVARRYGQDTVVEEVVQGREFRVALLGNGRPECLPLLEQAAKRRICPAGVDTALAERIRGVALAAFRAAGCRDYARIDVRVDAEGQPRVVDVQCVGVLARRGSFALAAEAAGYDFRRLIGRIVEVAARRYQAPAVLGVAPAATDSHAVVSLAERRNAPDRPLAASRTKGSR